MSNNIEIFSDRDIYPFDNYAERVAYIRSAVKTTMDLEAECAKPLITIIVGGANVGKSCLFNLLAGEDISPVKEISGYTRDFFIAADPDVDLKALEEISPDPLKVYKTSKQWMRGKILIDTPDFDSINDHNRKRLEEIMPLAHMVVILVTVAKREIAPLVEILLRYSGRKTFLFVMNKQDREGDYNHEFTAFLQQCGFVDPLVIRASCISIDNRGSLVAEDKELRQGAEKIKTEIGRVNEKHVKVFKYQGDVRDVIELLYNPTEIKNTLTLLEEKKIEFEMDAKKVLQDEIASVLSSLAHHPKIVRDVVLVELAGRRWFILNLLLRIWARYRFALAMVGAGSFVSRASGSVIPFFSSVASGLLAQSGRVSSLDSLRSQVRRGLDKNSFIDFFHSKHHEIRELLNRCLIRKDLFPSEDLSSMIDEYKCYLEQGMEKYVSGLVKKSYNRVLVFLELLVWMGTAGYVNFRARAMYQNNQMTLEAIIFAALACFIILVLVFLSGFVLYVGASTRKRLKEKIVDVNVEMDFSHTLQPAINALKHFEKSAEDGLRSIGKEQ